MKSENAKGVGLRGNSFASEYYERAWPQIAASISSREEEPIRQTISLIPEGVSSILDVGCGDGRVTNRLVSRYSKVVGLESSREALRYVEAEKLLGSVDSLPLADRSFALILCCEVLEHLPFRVYPKALEEIERVAAKYIIVTVPNNEDIKRALVTCPHCGCSFHPWRHLRSFTPKKLKELLGQFELQKLQLYQPSAKVYPTFLVKVAKLTRLIPVNSFPATAVCPQCGYSVPSSTEASLKANTTNKDSLLAHLLRSLAERLVPTRKRGTWLLALYQRILK